VSYFIDLEDEILKAVRHTPRGGPMMHENDGCKGERQFSLVGFSITISWISAARPYNIVYFRNIGS
jgi:hypothetical protein